MSDKVEKAAPVPVERALTKLGRDLSLARRRRRLTQASLAERIQTSVATLRRLEHGDPQVAFGVVVRAFHALGEIDRIARVLDTSMDDIGLTLMNEQVPRRVRTRRLTPETGAM
jgi:transcriptional regulator with XRE-family HTH domain